MNRFSVLPLSEPGRVRLPGRRAQTLQWAVAEGLKVRAIFEDERHADAYCRRLNAWERETRHA